MARFLILIILGFILVKILKRMAASADANTTNKSTNKPAAKEEEKMVQCTYCGCHVPMSESQLNNNKIICNNPECQR